MAPWVGAFSVDGMGWECVLMKEVQDLKNGGQELFVAS